MRKMKNYLKTGILLLGISLLLWNCEKEDSINNQQVVFETVSINETISFFGLKKASSKAKSYNENYVTPNLEDITQEGIINSSELLTIVSASTIYEKHYSRILLLKINQEIRSVVFSMYPSKNSTNGKFSGEIMITDLNGDFLNGYRVTEGQLKTQFKLRNTGNKTSISNKSLSDVCPDHGECTEGSYCVFCNQTLEEVVVTGNSGGSGNSVPITGLYNYEGVDQGGSSGPDTGMGWDYGDGGGSGNVGNNEEQEEKPCVGDPLQEIGISDFNSGKNANRFGCVRKDPTRICENIVGDRFHAGIDLKSEIGALVYSISDGQVFAAGTSTTFGNYIIIKTDDLFFLYAHLNQVPNINGSIKTNQQLAISGESATVGEPHLHIEVRKRIGTENYNNMVKLDIEDYLTTKFDSNGNTVANNCN